MPITNDLTLCPPTLVYAVVFWLLTASVCIQSSASQLDLKATEHYIFKNTCIVLSYRWYDLAPLLYIILPGFKMAQKFHCHGGEKRHPVFNAV